MPELSHDTAEDGFHEIQLSGKQLVFLFIVTTSVVVAVFLCGVLVGRGARAARGEEPEAAVATSPPQAQSAPDLGPPAGDPPAPAADSADELSYHKRLESEATPTEALKTKPEDSRPAPPRVVEPEPAPPPAVPRPTAPAPAPAPAAKTPQPAAKAPQDVAADVPVSGRPGTWVVQVIATRDPSVATSIVKRLTAKGYPAFLLKPVPNAPQPFYKVHVGRYNDRGEAEQVSLRIKKEEQFASWISR